MKNIFKKSILEESGYMDYLNRDNLGFFKRRKKIFDNIPLMAIGIILSSGLIFLYKPLILVTVVSVLLGVCVLAYYDLKTSSVVDKLKSRVSSFFSNSDNLEALYHELKQNEDVDKEELKATIGKIFDKRNDDNFERFLIYYLDSLQNPSDKKRKEEIKNKEREIFLKRLADEKDNSYESYI